MTVFLHKILNLKMRIGSFALLLFMVISCADKRPVQENHITEDRLNAFELRTPQRVVLTTPADSLESVFVINQHIITFQHPDGNGQPFLHILAMNGQEICSLVKKGGGRDEMLMALPSVSNNMLLMMDVLQRQLAFIDITEAVKPSFSILKYRTNILSQRIIPYKDRLMFLNPYSYRDQAKRILISDREWNYSEKKHYSFNAFNIVCGEVLYEDQSERVVYLSRHEPIAEVLDTKGTLKKRIIFPHHVPDVAEIWHEDRNIKEYVIIAQDDYPEDCFVSADSNSNCIAAVFRTDDWKSVIMVFNWDGDILDGFKVDTLVYNISLASDSGKVWCWEKTTENGTLKEYPIYLDESML